jgi:hypothetical protein
MFGALILAAALYCPSLPAVAQHRLPAAIFDSDPNHIWNRTHSCLFVRQSAGNANGGSVAVHPPDKEYATFMTHGMDDFESPAALEGQEILKRCRGCHSDSDGPHPQEADEQKFKGAAFIAVGY